MLFNQTFGMSFFYLIILMDINLLITFFLWNNVETFSYQLVIIFLFLVITSNITAGAIATYYRSKTRHD